MGEGFVVLQTADCKITYYQDEPGFLIFYLSILHNWGYHQYFSKSSHLFLMFLFLLWT